MSSTAPAGDVDDPVAYFLEDMAGHGRAQRTRSYYERVLQDFTRFLANERDVDGPAAATHRDCLAFVDDRREACADSTVATYASYLHRFYDYMGRVGAFGRNPMALVLEELDESVDVDPVRRDVSLPSMRSFVSGIAHPLDRAVIVTLLKTGMRAGELCNLDVRDVHLDVDTADSGVVRPAIEERPDSLFVPAEPARSHVYNDERRRASNKRRRDTVIPVDDELSGALLQWLAVRPDAPSSASPLFVSTRDAWGERLTTDMVHHVVRRHAVEEGWYDPGGDAAENVTPHYFRHFFTTNLRDRTGDRGVVKYLRGDVASDVIDTYTHDWGDRVRSVYLENIYSIM